MSEEQQLLATAPDARDITAELAAPPRRKLPWVTLVLSGCVIATLSFAGGVWYQKDNGPTTTAARAGGQGQRQGFGQGGGFPGGYGGGQNGGTRGGQNGGTRGGQNGAGQGANGAGFTRGTVTAVDGTTVYLTDATGNTVKVTTGDTTKVTLNKQGKVGDLQPGQTVTVLGTKGDDGAYTATQLTEGAGGFGGQRNGNGG